MSTATRAKRSRLAATKGHRAAKHQTVIPRAMRTGPRFSVMNRSTIANLGSQTGSQRHPIPADVTRQRIWIFAGQRPLDLRQPTPADASAVARNEQVIGSIPTGGSGFDQRKRWLEDHWP
jgi:hypothetical protein